MSDAELEGLARQIDEMIENQAREDRARAVADKTELIAGSYGAKEAGERADSQTEPWENFKRGYSAAQMFAPFVSLPDPATIDATIAATKAASGDLRWAQNELLTNLAAETSTAVWDSPAGEAFRDRRAGLTRAAGEHVLLAQELTILCATHKSLLEETHKAARELASQSLEQLKSLGAEGAKVNWRALINLALVVAAVAVTPESPATGAALLIARATTVKSILDAGRDVLDKPEPTVQGPTVWEVLASLDDLLRRLREGTQEKAQWIVDAFYRAPAAIEDNRSVVMPEPVHVVGR